MPKGGARSRNGLNIINSTCPLCFKKFSAASLVLHSPGCKRRGGKPRSLYQERRAWIAKNPEKERKIRMRASLKRYYGISIEEWTAILLKQNGLCAICGIKPEPDNYGRNGFHVDHHHGTGKVRGLLCRQCNWMLGNAKDDAMILNSAAKYLRKHDRDV